MSDADLNFEFVNRTWLEYTGTTQAGNAGRRRTERVIDEDRDLVTGDIDRAVVDAAPFRIGFRFRRDDGSVRQGLFHGVPRHDATGRLVGLAGTVVDVTALSRSHDELRRHRDELEATVQARTAELEAVSKERDVRIAVQCRTADTRAAFDPARIAQVVRNLLSNALKFTPAEREVTVIVESCDLAGAAVAPGARSPALRVTVSDEGVGIPDDELEAVFDKFIQSSSTKSGAGGTGLGLAITREIVEQHGGRIHARNNARGGADFVVVLPRDPVVVAQSVTGPGGNVE